MEILFDITMVLTVEDDADEEAVAQALSDALNNSTAREDVQTALDASLGSKFEDFFFDTLKLQQRM